MNSNKKELEGVVITNKMQKTVVVQTQRFVRHETFKKFYMDKKKYKVHDEKSECKVGDRVLIRETRPISKEKCWAVVKILEKAA